VAWSEIRRFRLGRWGVIKNVCLLDLVDGTTHHAWGISGVGQATGLVADLNERLSYHHRKD